MGFIIVAFSIIAMLGTYFNNVVVLLTVFYNSVLTIIFLSIFAFGALAMNGNIIDWIDNHWDILRNKVFSYDMETFKNHVTTELNSLGIFSLTINATLIIKMICIANLLSLRHIILALSSVFNIVFSNMAIALIFIGFYSMQHSYYTTIPTWANFIIIAVGIVLLAVGIMGYYSTSRFKVKIVKYFNISLVLCFLLLVSACVGFFFYSTFVNDNVELHWDEIKLALKEKGIMVRKSFLLNQIQINLKFSGLYTLVFSFFTLLSIFSNFYNYQIINNERNSVVTEEVPEKEEEA